MVDWELSVATRMDAFSDKRVPFLGGIAPPAEQCGRIAMQTFSPCFCRVLSGMSARSIIGTDMTPQ